MTANMNIILVEDEAEQSQTSKTEIEQRFPGSNVQVIETESEFLRSLPEFQRCPPALFIFDMMLPWSSIDSYEKAGSPLGYPKTAGLRCAKAVLANKATAQVPMIVHSVLSVAEIRPELGTVPPNLAILEKRATSENLLLMVNSLLRAAHHSNLVPPSPEIFIVHGHDDEAKETVARYIEKLGGRAVILHEQPNSGRTLIEKFEKHANVEFAIVLLTPDDMGGKSPKTLKFRARQNVIFELGFFFGKLGRNKVCALHKEEVEIPSDVQGVVYIPMDKAGAWRMTLLRELKAAELPLDFEKAI
jgi:predicted nucleotide-binding protein